MCKKVQVGKDQEKVQSDKDSHSKTEAGKNKPTIRHSYHETYEPPRGKTNNVVSERV